MKSYFHFLEKSFKTYNCKNIHLFACKKIYLKHIKCVALQCYYNELKEHYIPHWDK